MMKHGTLVKTVLLLAILLMATLVSAQPQGRGRGMYGDWILKSEINGREMTSILAFSRDQAGHRTASMINYMVHELKDVIMEDGKLTFTQINPNGDGGTRETKFTATITDGVFTGTVSGGQREYELTGKRAPRIPRAVGQWEMKYRIGDRERTSMLLIKADAEGNLSATMAGGRGESTISDLKLENRSELSFKRVSKWQDREFESTFTGTLEMGGITGVLKSERGEIPATATRFGSALIGTWNLDVVTDRGALKQRLVVNGDLSGLYGPIPVKEIKLEGDAVSFKLVTQFGDNTLEMDFAGKIVDSKLTGELSNDQWSQKITGTKVVRTRRGPRTAR
jgi:hypothetical protein